MPQIPELTKGDTDTLLHADRGNEIIQWLNALLAIEVSPLGAARFIYAEGKIVLLLNNSKQVIFSVIENGALSDYSFTAKRV